MITKDLPLLELFTRLRQADLPLDIDDYLLVLRALQAGFGITDLDALSRLCRTLWVKSTEEAFLFDHHFPRLMAQSITREDGSLFSQKQSHQSEDLPSSELAMSLELTLEIEDEVQAAQAVLQTVNKDGFPYSRFVQTDEYFPVTRRQMKQSWRYLRRPIREGPPVELDVEATVNEIGREGILLKPVLVPRRINRAELLLLIDQGGSMVPFHALSHRLVETALRGGRLRRAGIYYFHNCPIDYIYRDPLHGDAEYIQDILDCLYDDRTSVLIFSDAGAARGGFSLERIESTRKFLDQLRQKFRYTAWLNPMPRLRWSDTTAEKLMHLIPMFDLSRRGLDDAINVLRGSLSHFVSTLSQRHHE